MIMATTLKGELRDIIQYRNAYLLAFSATTGYVCFGWEIGLIGGVITLPSFQEYFGLLSESASARASLSANIVSVLQAGGFFGALFSSYFASRFGRKPALIASGVIYLIGSIIQSTAGIGTSSAVGLKVLYFSRFFGGMGVGLMSALVPAYVSECAPRAIRGRCTGCIEVSVGLGNMLAFWVNYSVSLNISPGQMQWRLPFIVQIIPGALLVVFMLFQPESPRWLVERGHYDEAAAALAYIARKDQDDVSVVLTLGEIRADFIGKHRLPLLTQFRKMGESKIIFLRCIIASIATFFQQWSGTNAINYYAPQIFAGLGFSSTSSALFATGIYGVIKFVVTCMTLAFVIESWGRKRSLIYGGLAQGSMMLWLGGYAGIHPHQDVVPATYVSIVAIYLYGVFFCLGWGFTPFVLGSEVAPGHLRMAAMSLAAAITWLFTYVIAQITPILLDRITYGTYLLFGVASLIMAAWVYIFIPETTGYPLEDIKYLFERDIILRSLEDAPLGWIFLGKRRAVSVEELKAADTLPTNSPKDVSEELRLEEASARGHSLRTSNSQGYDDPLII
ncbi:general substrate transporter [Suillus fuscotomentosus]|uniref:General substrate transporter n=1 Tax=Suillus fuscotomentosus TaxID=1912939 RepID=A0AAD4HHM0_9AGAM|nr:general substrate transporter [Suillus fuscotomentosus]KAG1896923.1 general substrate transporter [Suillus fuscotomentosus]